MRARLSDIRARLRRRRRARAARVARLGSGTSVLLAAAVGVALGCGWTGTEHSVRFNAWLSEAEFSRLPALPFTARGPKKVVEEHWWEAAEQLAEKTARVWVEASTAALNEDMRRARELLTEYLALTEGPDCGMERLNGDTGCRWRRRSAFDQLDALSALDSGAQAQAVGAYLSARTTYDAQSDWTVARRNRETSVGSDAGASPNSGAGSGDGTVERTGEAQAEAASGEDETRAAREVKAAELKQWAADVRAKLARVPRGVGLDDNVAYLRAAVLAEENLTDFDATVRAYEGMADAYPRSEKREAALFSAAMLRLRSSRGGLGGAYATADEVGAHLRDEDWSEAARLFRRILREHPRGRHATDARGWLGFLHLRVGETAEGLAEYYRLLAEAPNDGMREEALRSLRLVRHEATEADLSRLERLIEDEPRAALAYAHHSVYNFALRGAFQEYLEDEENPYNYCYNNNTLDCADKFYAWQRAESERRHAKGAGREMARVAEFAARMMRRHPGAGYGAGFAARVAGIKLELGEPRAAHDLARRALALGPASDDERATALWVKGVAEYRLRDYGAARKTLLGLATEFPAGDFAEGARRYVALAAEDAGDIEGALEQYLALDYTADTAYFLDVLLTPEQIASFIERRPEHPRRDVLLYSLGVRHMRRHEFAAARSAFARIKTTRPTGHGGNSYSDPCAERWAQPENAYRCFDPKRPDEEEAGVVLARWVERDLRTMDEIEAREHVLAEAAGDEAKAEALYQLAGYYYDASELVFYNPATWRGGRFHVLYYDHKMRAPDEPRLFRRYMEEHEQLKHALDIYLRITREYPQTRAARDSLYTAAVIHERLSTFLLYWPEQYEMGLQVGDSMVTYADVRRIYPGYQLPRGTRGWEPATRTVNGRHGWEAPPRREPLTRGERLRRKIKRAEAYAVKGWQLFGEIGGGRVRRWSLVLLFSAGALLLLRLTRRSRALLLDLFVKGARARRKLTTDFLRVPASSYGAERSYALPARASAAAARTWQALRAVALDERGRVALVVNFFTHGLLTALVYAVTWALRLS
jgi:TolA-binding protein